MKGKCTRGRQCKFKHPQCRKFANNEPCTYGERCKFVCYKDEQGAEQGEQQPQRLASNESQASAETPTAPTVRTSQQPPAVGHMNIHDNLNTRGSDEQQSENTSQGGAVSMSQNNGSGEETFLGKKVAGLEKSLHHLLQMIMYKPAYCPPPFPFPPGGSFPPLPLVAQT